MYAAPYRNIDFGVRNMNIPSFTEFINELMLYSTALYVNSRNFNLC